MTIALPVGDFGDTQLPLFIVIYLASMIATWFTFRKERNWTYGIVAFAVALAFPTLFGSSSTSQALQLGPLTITDSAHQIGGLAGILVLLGWPVVKTRRDRKQKMLATRIAGATSQQEKKTKRRQRLRASIMVLTALVAAIATTIPLTSLHARSVPRNAVKHHVEAPELSNPLAGYRSNFTSTSLNTNLLSFTGEAPSRVRFATLSSYDGLAFRPTTSAQSRERLTDFERVPYRVGNTTGALHITQVTINDYSGQWVPIASEFSQVEFTGKNTLALREGFYLNINAQTAIDKIERGEDIGLLQGDVYTLTYADSNIVESTDKGVASMRAYTKAPINRPSEEDFPSLHRWLTNQHAGTATVSEVVRLHDELMTRSYLGRSKSQPTGQVTWLPRNYNFRPSDAGHNIERIETIFANMIDPKYQTCATPTDQCAAHVGDEEQYAAATALIARAIGFPSRIVYGAHVPSDGVVTGKNVTVWTEIQVADGSWVALDVTPRIDNAFVEQPDVEAYRQYNPATGQENAPTLDPPAKDPSTSGDNTPTDEDLLISGKLLTYLVGTAKVVGTGLLITSPIWGILLAKIIRRRRRYNQKDPNAKILGGWNEYVDHLIDSGEDIPPYLTRKEITNNRSERARALANGADYAAFSGSTKTPKKGAEIYWEQVNAERTHGVREQKKLQRLRTHLSPKSFARYRSKRKNNATKSQSRFQLRVGKKKVEQ
ncbi:MAG: transglutaminase domain-containing protein [Actinomycetaceae bacterium]|nr:transglutaminase domain-containing protein [Actinomycetaceae bacterium]